MKKGAGVVITTTPALHSLQPTAYRLNPSCPALPLTANYLAIATALTDFAAARFVKPNHDPTSHSSATPNYGLDRDPPECSDVTLVLAAP